MCLAVYVPRDVKKKPGHRAAPSHTHSAHSAPRGPAITELSTDPTGPTCWKRRKSPKLRAEGGEPSARPRVGRVELSRH